MKGNNIKKINKQNESKYKEKNKKKQKKQNFHDFTFLSKYDKIKNSRKKYTRNNLNNKPWNILHFHRYRY